ncbi:serine hydrolase domain-containing protein [Labedella endophytica]|uniref:Class A beta-lactamase-related serine hydrolase n=1 Tax=Labedella endophytica TaxID=1523160 RepID=A0A3S0Y0B4_9MICO|nr:serine hydrolase domain-containing protein [Labedella endophytica]RUR01246.1 class A beta-lactamase-related serine hydrolase [Labedella endophytica]
MTIADTPPESWSGSALVMRGGEVIEEVSVGTTAGPGSPACSARSRFQAGSISKQVMSVVTLSLVHRGILELDGPIGQWLTGLPARLQPIMLRQLLSHSSGIGHWGDIPGLPPLLETPPGRDALVELIGEAQLVSEPGDGWRYSGPGFVVVALVVEAATGRPYGEVAEELVFSRAGMRDTTSGRFPIGETDVAVGRRGGRYIEVEEGFTHLPGTGDLWTTTTDLLRYSRALRSDDLIDSGLASLLWTEHVDLDPPDPADQPASATAYGFGTFIGRVREHDAWFVPGDNPGYQSLMAFLPRRDIAIAVLGNAEAPGVSTILRQLNVDS